MEKLIKMLFISLIFAFSVSGKGVTVTASAAEMNPSIETLDEILLDANTPKSVLNSMDDEMKQFIYENSGTDIEYVEVKEEEIPFSNRITPYGYQISTSNLRLSVLAYKVSGKNQVDVYPQFDWLTPTAPIGKDFFGYSASSSYSVVPNQRSNKVFFRKSTSNPWELGSTMTYTSTHQTGYQHKGTSVGKPLTPVYIKAQAFMRLDIDSSNPVNKIFLSYVHDKSTSSSYSYTITFGPLSIGVTPNSSSVGYSNNAYYLNY